MKIVEQSSRESHTEIYLCDEKTRNSLSREMMSRLIELINQASERKRPIVIAGRGAVFSSGHNFRELKGISLEDARTLFDLSKDLVHAIRSSPCPVVAKVQGPAIGAGCMLALSCDFALASSSATFQTPGGARGWFCFTPMVALNRSCAPKRALEMLFSGESISAQRAFEWGMINRVVDPDAITKEVEEFSFNISRGDFEMLRLGKALFYQTLGRDFSESIDIASRYMTETCLTEAAQNRISSAVKG